VSADSRLPDDLLCVKIQVKPECCGVLINTRITRTPVVFLTRTPEHFWLNAACSGASFDKQTAVMGQFVPIIFRYSSSTHLNICLLF